MPNKEQHDSAGFNKGAVSDEVMIPDLTHLKQAVCSVCSLSLSLWNELGGHENWADLQRYIMYEELEGSYEFCSGGIRESSQVEILAGHLKHTICGNISTWRRSTRFRLYSSSSSCSLKYATQTGFYSGHRGGLLGQQGIKGLDLTFRLSPTLHNLKLLFAI